MKYRTVQVDFQLSSFNFTQFQPHSFICSEPCSAHIKRPIFSKLPGPGISPCINFLIADVIKFVPGTMITFSQGGAAKIKSKQFSEFGSRTVCFTWL